MIKHVITFIFTLFFTNIVLAQKPIFNILEKQENALIVEFTLPDYQISDLEMVNGFMHQKISASEAVAILKKGFPEVLKLGAGAKPIVINPMSNNKIAEINPIMYCFMMISFLLFR